MESMVLESAIPSGLHFEHIVAGNEPLGRIAREHAPLTRMTPNDFQFDEIVGKSEGKCQDSGHGGETSGIRYPEVADRRS
jgi:hypothetical protein